MSPQPTILIVDDEKHTRDGLRRLLENDYDVYVAPDLGGAMNVLKHEQIDVLLTDLRLGGEDGMQLIDRALKMPRPPICIMMTAYGSVDVAVEAMKRGAYDFVTKPQNRAGKSCAPAASGRAVRTREHLGRLGCLARGARHDPAGRAFLGQCAYRRRERHRKGTGRERDS